MHMRAWITTAFLAAVTGVAPGCGAGQAPVQPAPQQGTPTPDPSKSHAAVPKPSRDPMVALATELPDGHVEVIGIVMKERGTASTERPIECGNAVAMPVARFEAFQAAAGGTWKARVQEGSEFPMPAALLKEPTVFSAEIKPDGTWTMLLPPGEYQLCLGNVGKAGDVLPDLSIWVQGCVEVTVTDEDFQTIVLTLDRPTGRITRLE